VRGALYGFWADATIVVAQMAATMKAVFMTPPIMRQDGSWD
jgi:hypothetical protein